MNEETLRILKMIEEGKITAEQGKNLIEAMTQSSTNTSVSVGGNYEDKFLKVKVLSAKGDRVNVKLPIKVIKEVVKITGKLPIQTEGMQGVNLDEIMDTVARCLDKEVMGEIVDVESVNGDIVKIVIE